MRSPKSGHKFPNWVLITGGMAKFWPQLDLVQGVMAKFWPEVSKFRANFRGEILWLWVEKVVGNFEISIEEAKFRQ